MLSIYNLILLVQRCILTTNTHEGLFIENCFYREFEDIYMGEVWSLPFKTTLHVQRDDARL